MCLCLKKKLGLWGVRQPLGNVPLPLWDMSDVTTFLLLPLPVWDMLCHYLLVAIGSCTSSTPNGSQVVILDFYVHKGSPVCVEIFILDFCECRRV